MYSTSLRRFAIRFGRSARFWRRPSTHHRRPISEAPGRTLVGVDESHTLGAQGGHRSIDIGQDTDLATALYINDNGTIHATWHSDYHSSAVIKLISHLRHAIQLTGLSIQRMAEPRLLVFCRLNHLTSPYAIGAVSLKRFYANSRRRHMAGRLRPNQSIRRLLTVYYLRL